MMSIRAFGRRVTVFFVNILQQAGLHVNYMPLSRKPACRDVLNPRLPWVKLLASKSTFFLKSGHFAYQIEGIEENTHTHTHTPYHEVIILRDAEIN